MLDTQLCPTLWLHELWHARLLCPWTFPDKKTGVGCHTLLQGTFLTQGVNLGLLHWRQTLYHLSHQGSQIGILVIVICSNHFKAPVWQCYLRYYCLCLRPGEKTKVFFFFIMPHFPESRDPWASEKWPQCISRYITMSCDKFCNQGMKHCCVYGFPWISSSLSLGKMKFVKYVFMPLSALGASVSLIFYSTHSRLLPKISCPWHRLSFCHLMHPKEEF